MSFFAFGALNRIGTNNQLFKLNQLIDWSRISSKLQGIHKNETNSLGGPKAYNNLSMFKAILLG
jgi:hypothetical protein